MLTKWQCSQSPSWRVIKPLPQPLQTLQRSSSGGATYFGTSTHCGLWTCERDTCQCGERRVRRSDVDRASRNIHAPMLHRSTHLPVLLLTCLAAVIGLHAPHTLQLGRDATQCADFGAHRAGSRARVGHFGELKFERFRVAQQIAAIIIRMWVRLISNSYTIGSCTRTVSRHLQLQSAKQATERMVTRLELGIRTTAPGPGGTVHNVETSASRTSTSSCRKTKLSGLLYV